VTTPDDRPEQPDELTGIDLVRRTLEEARAAARAQGKDAGRGRALPPAGRRVAGQRRSWSGPGPDIRDPQPLAGAARELAKKRGWSAHVAEAPCSVTGRQWSGMRSPTTRPLSD
jgi:predicted nucleic acid-binding Zn ribbon protein